MNIRLTAFVLMAMFENLLILVQGLGWNYLNSKVLIYHVFIESNNTPCFLQSASSKKRVLHPAQKLKNGLKIGMKKIFTV